MPRDKNRPRPFRGTFSFHLPAAKSCWLRAARLHRRRLHFRRASGIRALESFGFTQFLPFVPLRFARRTYMYLTPMYVIYYIYILCTLPLNAFIIIKRIRNF